MNPLARCNREKIGGKDAPVQGKVENMDAYDFIYVGFPYLDSGKFIMRSLFPIPNASVFCTL